MDIDTSDLARRLEFARCATLDAGRVTLEYFRRDNYEVERKEDDSPVTAADREAERLLRQRIAAEYPDDGVVGEEYGEQAGRSGLTWILDPIDGTKSFVSGVPLYGTLVGLERDGQGLLGVIGLPALGEIVYAARGQGAWQQIGEAPPRPARVSGCATLGESVFLTSQVDCFALRDAGQVYLRLQAAARVTRTWGDCYGYALLATGRADVMVDAEMHVWDAAAVQPVVEEAGGRFTDWSGRDSLRSGEGLATTAALHEAVLEITRPFARRAEGES